MYLVMRFNFELILFVCV